MFISAEQHVCLYNKIKRLSKSSFPNKEMVKKGNVIEIDIKENDGKEATTFAMIKEIYEDDDEQFQ